MVVPPATGGAAPVSETAVHAPSIGSFQVDLKPIFTNGIFRNYPPHIPLSQRRAPPLDMSTVERRGHPLAARESNKRVRPHGLEEAPTFRPTEAEFKDPFAYIEKIRREGEKYGICKIIPPDSWDPDFAIPTERFFFKTRRQELNSVEGGTRTNLQYLDQLAKFHKQHGMNLNRFPSVDKRPLDLYKLKKAVETRGGFEKVCKLKKWAEIGRDLGYSGKIMSSLSTSLKNSYQKWLHPYEEYLKVAKPGVQQQLEMENGGPFTPNSAKNSMKGSQSQQNTPMSMRDDSPAVRASAALNASMNDREESLDKVTPVPEPTAPAPAPTPAPVSSGFTAVNSGGWAAVNLTPATFKNTTPTIPAPKRELENSGSGPPLQMIPNPNRGPAPIETKIQLYTPHQTNGHASNPLKRPFSHEGMNGLRGPETTGEGEDSTERRSKRAKKGTVIQAAVFDTRGRPSNKSNLANPDSAPTVVGSHMSLLRPPTPRLPSGQRNGKPGEICEVCGTKDDRSQFLVCDGCDYGYHKNCLDPPAKVSTNPAQDWHCPRCLVGTGDFGFEEGGIYSLRQFQEKAQHFKDTYFEPKMQFDPVLNTKRPVTEDDVEREFWRLVESPTEEVEVEYGADIHSTTHGSGFPTIEKNPLNPYSTDRWNLNILPLHEDSLFRHIKSDISGMTVPWLYVGMCFSTFCWHNEDHYGYSANYQHFGATKTWYGIPGADAERFEDAMRQAVPELFESQPDLLFQLVTLLPPDRLKKAGVNVYALDQRAGQFVITFPQAYHAGFNHGFNFNEAVNFAPDDWEPFGEAGVERLQAFRKQPCFSHDELLITAASKDASIKTAKWLGPALKRISGRELQQRIEFLARHKRSLDPHSCKIAGDMEPDAKCELGFEVNDQDLPEAEYQCVYCKAYSYLSSFRCDTTGKVLCLLHAAEHECCNASQETRYQGNRHKLRYRLTDDALNTVVQKVVDRAELPELWQEKVDKAIDDEEKPSLKVLRSLVSEGEKIPWDLPGLPDLKNFVEKCNDWVEEATNYITRKQQNRRKNDKVWRKGSSAKAAELEEREKELRKIGNINKLLAQAEEISFDCPEITTLAERSQAITEFQRDAKAALENPRIRSTQEFEDLAELGKGFNVDVPEVELLETVVQKMKWTDEARDRKTKLQTLDDVTEFIKRGQSIGIPEDDLHMARNKEMQARGQIWEEKAKELMDMEIIHHPQLEALSTQAEGSNLPITNETRARVDAILSKQREAQRQIISLYESCKDDDLRSRPKYKEVRAVLDGLSDLNSKPNGTVDLENAAKRHENWMRKGKKLFGKANAPLHILQVHMNYVADHNSYCFDLSDKPRMPVEPQSRENSPIEGQDIDGVKSEKNVFCMCRQSEAGTMIECGLCHEWYHSKCLKIARGKVKDDDEYTCPICDYRVKIPRDAARPKLEDLIDWRDEIQDLPFQPEEEEILTEIIDKANKFREYVRPYINPVLTTSEEVTTHRFYLRKIEGAEILLSFETNFFRQEVHKWSPVAPEPPPVLEQSLSTRKPRPTKQQKLMQQHNVSTPEELPLQFRRKEYNINKARKSSTSGNANIQAAPSRRPRSSHSTSTDNSADPRPRMPPGISTAGHDSGYAAHFPLPASHNPHQQPDSPAFAQSPYYGHSSHNPHSPFTDASHYGRQRSPLSATYPTDPTIDSPFASVEHPHGRAMQSPHHGYSNHSHPQEPVDNMFDEFVAHRDDDISQSNEVAEALEERGREHEDEDEKSVLREFVNDA